MFRRAYPAAFEEAWQLYPRHVGKDAAYNRWRTVTRGTTDDERAAIIAGIRRYSEKRRGQDKSRTAHMATWLNQGRWRDDPDDVQVDDPREASAGRRAGDVLRELLGSEFRARRLLDHAMPLARRLRLRDCDDGQLAHAVGRLLLDVDEAHRANRCAERGLALGPLELVHAYVEWLLERDYADATANVLRLDSASFGQFRAQLAHREDYGRDPVTGRGRSYE